MSKNGVLSPQEAAVLVSIIDGGDESSAYSLQRISEQFLQQFKEDTGARTRALYAMRALLGADYVSGSVCTATTPDTLSCLFLLHAVASAPQSHPDNADAARAALYEHLLRIEDLLRDDGLMVEQRKYKSTAAVGKQRQATARDASEKDAHRGHLLQKVFVVQCACIAAGAAGSIPADNMIADPSKNAPQLCKGAGTIEILEGIVTSWGPEEKANAAQRQQIIDAVAVLKGAYDKEQQKSVLGGLGSIGYGARGLEMPDGTTGSTNNLLRSSRLGSRHVLCSPALAHPLSLPSTWSSNAAAGEGAVSAQGAHASLAPQAQIRPPPRGRVGADARLLLPCGSSTLLLDATAHPPDWREAKAIVDAAMTSELSNAQLQKLTALLGNSAGGGSNGNKPSASGKKGGAGSSSSAGPTELFPYLGITPAVFGALSRTNPKAATVLAQRLDKSNGGPYAAQLVDFNSTDRPDAPTVLLAAARAGFVAPSHLSNYVSKTKGFLQQIGGMPGGAETARGVEFLKTWAVTLHQVNERCPLENADKQTVVSILSQFGDALSEVCKMWTS